MHDFGQTTHLSETLFIYLKAGERPCSFSYDIIYDPSFPWSLTCQYFNIIQDVDGTAIHNIMSFLWKETGVYFLLKQNQFPYYLVFLTLETIGRKVRGKNDGHCYKEFQAWKENTACPKPFSYTMSQQKIKVN